MDREGEKKKCMLGTWLFPLLKCVRYDRFSGQTQATLDKYEYAKKSRFDIKFCALVLTKRK
jgi:hypothetical protein